MSDERLTVRIPKSLGALLKQYLALDTHLNESDFLRDAIREKLRRDAPELYRQLFVDREKPLRPPAVTDAPQGDSQPKEVSKHDG